MIIMKALVLFPLIINIIVLMTKGEKAAFKGLSHILCKPPN